MIGRWFVSWINENGRNNTVPSTVLQRVLVSATSKNVEYSRKQMIGRLFVSWISENGRNIYFFVKRVRHEFKFGCLSTTNKWQVEVECLFKTDLIQCGDQICQFKCLKWWQYEAQSQFGGVSYLDLYSCYYIPQPNFFANYYEIFALT